VVTRACQTVIAMSLTKTPQTCSLGIPRSHYCSTHKVHQKYAFVSVLSITSSTKNSLHCKVVTLPLRVKVTKSTFATTPGDV